MELNHGFQQPTAPAAAGSGEVALTMVQRLIRRLKALDRHMAGTITPPVFKEELMQRIGFTECLLDELLLSAGLHECQAIPYEDFMLWLFSSDMAEVPVPRARGEAEGGNQQEKAATPHLAAACGSEVDTDDCAQALPDGAEDDGGSSSSTSILGQPASSRGRLEAACASRRGEEEAAATASPWPEAVQHKASIDAADEAGQEASEAWQEAMPTVNIVIHGPKKVGEEEDTEKRCEEESSRAHAEGGGDGPSTQAAAFGLSRQVSVEYCPFSPDFSLEAPDEEEGMGDEIGPSVSERPINRASASASASRLPLARSAEEAPAPQGQQRTSTEDLEYYLYDLCNPYELNVTSELSIKSVGSMSSRSHEHHRRGSDFTDVSNVSEFWQDTTACRAGSTATSKLQLELSSQRRKIQEFEAEDEESDRLKVAQNTCRQAIITEEEEEEQKEEG